jgi:Rad3-related DNA helicase
MMIDLTDQIVIMDEAHNCEEACRESTSFTFTKFQVETSLLELRKLLNYGLIEADVKEAAQYFILLVYKYSKK